MTSKLLSFLNWIFLVRPTNGIWGGNGGKQNLPGFVTYLMLIPNRRTPCPLDINMLASYTESISDPQLLISSSEGIVHVPLLPNASYSGHGKRLLLHTSSPSHVQCDVGRRQIFWAEINEKRTVILRVSLDIFELGPEVVYSWYPNSSIRSEPAGRKFKA